MSLSSHEHTVRGHAVGPRPPLTAVCQNLAGCQAATFIDHPLCARHCGRDMATHKTDTYILCLGPEVVSVGFSS